MYGDHKPPKLVDARQHGAQSGAELFVVEGDSASLAVAQQRDGRFQAVLPMQGKPMNPTRVSQEKLAENPLYAALIDAIGIGVGPAIDVTKRRYQRIMLLMDPDADGIHCGALMTLFFHRWMQPLLAAKAIYLVRPPIGQYTHLDTGKIEYLYTPADFKTQRFNAQANKADTANAIDCLKYRGLAGMPPSGLEACCINPQTRRQLLLTEKDAAMAANVFG